MTAIVYLLQFPNGKSYVGRTTKTLKARFRNHINAANKGSRCAVHAAIRKYGADCVSILSLAQGLSWAESAEVEIQWIEDLGTMTPNGYNMTRGGEGVVDPSGAVAAKISQTLRGHAVSERTRTAVSEAAKRMWAEDHEKLRARMADVATRSTTRAALAKKLGSTETRKKMSESAKARWAKRRVP